MPRFKATMFFTQRSSGWSESFYLDASSEGAVRPVMNALASRRLACANLAVTVPYIRIEDITLPGTARLFNPNLARASNRNSDTPWQSLLVRLQASDGSRRMYLLRGLPDEIAVNGAYQPDPDFRAAIDQFLGRLSSTGCRLKVIKKSNLFQPISNISNAGQVTTIGAHGLNVGSIIKFDHTHDDNGVLVSGLWTVNADVSSNVFGIASWPGTRTASAGKFRKQEADYPLITATDVRRIGKRNVGRPFGLPLGRRRRPAA